MKAPWAILMIEDSATDAELVVRALKYGNVSNPLQVATTGEQGLDALLGTGAKGTETKVRPGLILLDLNLPGMSGIEVLRQFKADERTRAIPVVVLSLSENDRNIMACVRLGADGYIVKPLDLDNLIRVTTKLNLTLTLLPPLVTERKKRAV